MDSTVRHPAIYVEKYPHWPEYYVADADFILESSDNYEFYVNKAVLSEESDIFAALFASVAESQRQKAELPDVTAEVMMELLKFIYEGDTTVNFPNVADQVYYAADKYNVAELKEVCVEQLSDQLSVDSICATVDLAKKFGLNQLVADCLLFIRDEREHPEMPWGHLAQLCDGELLKEIVLVASADDSYVAQI